MHLYPHQRELLEKNPDIHLLAHGTGSGKTLMSIELAKKRNESTLVISPKHLKEKWQRDMADFPNPTMILTKEEFKKHEPHLMNYPCVIVDEAHTFAGMKSQLHKSLLKYFKKWDTPYRYLLTASPYLSTPWNIYALALLCKVPLSYTKFRNTFFFEMRMGHRHIWKAREGQKYRDLLHKIVAKIGSSVQLDDVFEVPAQKHEKVMLELTGAQEAAVAEVYHPVAIAQWTAIHRVENTGGVKEAWIKDFALRHTKFVIFVRYIDQLNALVDMLTADGNNVLYIHGGVKDRDSVIRQANEMQYVILIIQAQCSEGYELPTFDTVVYASMSFSYKDLLQSQGRVLRANALHENDYYYLVIEGGVDEEVYKSLNNKQDFSFELLERRAHQ